LSVASVIIAVIGAGALAIVTGLVNPNEKVNGLWLVVAAACIYVLSYRFYGRWPAAQVVGLITPCDTGGTVERRDSVFAG